MSDFIQNEDQTFAPAAAIDQEQKVEAAPAKLTVADDYDILDLLPQDSFDHLMEMAANIFEAPIGALKIAESDRIWISPASVYSRSEHIKSPSFCGFTRSAVDNLKLRGNTTARSLTMALVAIEFGMRFHVGVPLTNFAGLSVGMLCAMDREPRLINDHQIRQLTLLADIVMDQIEAHISVLRAVASYKLLSSETDHRVMNSLQFVSGLLTMQSRAVGAPEAVVQLALAANRVAAVARVHRHFALNEGAQCVPVLAFLRRLCGELSIILDMPIEVSGIEASVPANQVQAIGFSVNELISNAKKYGAPPIKVTFAPHQLSQHQLCITDAGGGLPPDFIVSKGKRDDELGMKVVAALVSQLRGSLSAGPNAGSPGTRFAITFPRV